jgi:hypothetical protein
MRSVSSIIRLRAAGRSRGQVLVIVGVAMTVFIGIVGLAVDYGFWLTNQRALRNAADAASQAGVSEMLELPVTAAKQTAAAEHAMIYLNVQMGLGIGPADIPAAAVEAADPTGDGFGSEDALGYAGPDRFRIRTPVDAADESCTGKTWGKRSISVKIDRQAPRYFSAIFFGGTQEVDGCATSVIEGRGYAVAVLKPDGPGPETQDMTMRLDGQDSYVLICGGDVGINGLYRGGPAPPNPLVDPAYVKFLNANSDSTVGGACTTDDDNLMEMNLDALSNPSNPSWEVTPPQIRAEGAVAGWLDDPYLPPRDLTSYIRIPDWGSALYSALAAADATAPTLRMTSTTPGNGTCTPPAVPSPAAPYTDAINPGKYDLIELGVDQKRWLCPGVYHFVQRISGNPQGLQFGQGSILGGQGVTLVFDSESEVDIRSGAALLLNSAGAGGTPSGGPWTTGDLQHDVPIAIYVEPMCPVGTPTLSCDSVATDVFVMQAGAGIDIKGVIFGPTDEMKIAGNGDHHGAGEIWAWTLEYKGQSTLRQDYDGGNLGFPLLVE